MGSFFILYNQQHTFTTMPRKLSIPVPKSSSAVQSSLHNAYPSPIINSLLFTPPKVVATLHVDVIEALNTLITGKGRYREWEVIMRRMFVGSIAQNDYMGHNPQFNHLINLATERLQVIWIRYSCTEKMGVLVTELDLIQHALSTIDQTMRLLRPNEITTVYKDADQWLRHIELFNKRSEKTGKSQLKAAA